MMRRPAMKLLGAGLALLALVAGAACSPDNGEGEGTTAQRTVDTERAPVIRQDVVERLEVEATVGHGAVITLPIAAEGVVTWSGSPGSILRSGDVAVEVAGRPVVLVVGDTPLYRPLRLVGRNERDEAGTRLGPQTGDDVAQLQRFLLAGGFDDNGRLEVDEVFGLSTLRAVRSWQTSVGHPATGVIDTSQMVFMASELLLDNEQAVGQAFEGVDVTGTATVLRIAGSTTLRPFFVVGSTVEVLADTPTVGVVSRSTRVRSPETGNAEQLIEVTVSGIAPEVLGQSVSVVGSITRATDVVTIPVRALLAVSDGTWEVEIVVGADTERVVVELQQVVETTAIISGIDEGAEVVVPL